jgi:ribosome-associated toxin RatA of RatAB toxin-antitoxin module
MRAMRHFTRSALVAAPAARLYALINDVERYPEFVPWCVGARVISRAPGEVVAALDIKRSVLKTSFTTRNTLEEPHRITMQLLDGPFRSLSGRWTLTPIADASGASLGCRVELQMSFEFANAVSAALLESVFEQTVASLVEAFVLRARASADSPDGELR